MKTDEPTIEACEVAGCKYGWETEHNHAPQEWARKFQFKFHGLRKFIAGGKVEQGVVYEQLQSFITELVAEEREKTREIYEALELMFEQYCPNGNHLYMTAGETAEEVLQKFAPLIAKLRKQ